MNLEEKLDILAPAARFDACESHAQPGKRYTPRRPAWGDGPIVAESGPDGRPVTTFRVLLSSRCAWSCPYCPLRAAADLPRAALEPEELAAAFLPRVQRGAAQGLFLSTGVDGDVSAANDRMIDATEHLRTRHDYQGYVHLKLLPGASSAHIERAAQLADRLSINLEAPSAARLRQISPERDWAADLIAPLLNARAWAHGERQRTGSGGLRAGLATQFVVGAAGEPDSELLSAAQWLYRDLDLRRVYFGAFRPAPGTPLAAREPTPFIRQRRLNEADWLLRHYDFRPDELAYEPSGDLALHIDPKVAWALAHPERFPIEINTATEPLLLRVPGLGPLGVRRILRLRHSGRFQHPADLKALGTAAQRAIDFVLLDGRFFGRGPAALAWHYRRKTPIAEQLTLWE
jgi:predicted DNA-binding helix-hairpin-helix protein